MIYLVEKYSELALVSELQKGQRILAFCDSDKTLKDIPLTQNQIIDTFNRLEGNKILFNETLLFLDDRVTTLYTEIKQ